MASYSQVRAIKTNGRSNKWQNVADDTPYCFDSKIEKSPKFLSTLFSKWSSRLERSGSQISKRMLKDF